MQPGLLKALQAASKPAGTLRFDQFLEIVLYDPEFGYYSTKPDRASHAGDFVTAVEVAPLFAQCAAHWLDGVRQSTGAREFHVVEAGAGRGTLAQGIWDHAPKPLRDALVSHLVEKGTAPRDALRTRFEGNPRVHVYDDISKLPARLGTGAFIANELFDNLLVRRLMKADGWKEIHVKVTPTKIREELVPAPPDLVEMAESHGIRLSEGQSCEVSPHAAPLLTSVLGRFDRGGFLVFDYGGHAEEVSGANAPNGTLRSYVAHSAHPDLYADLGNRDITQDVNVTPLITAARSLGYSTKMDGQGKFLLEHGLAERLLAAQEEEKDELARLRLAQRAKQLFHPEIMGETFFALHGRKT